MKAFKKLLLYFFIIIGIVVVAVLVGLGYMYFSPGSSLLGYEYIVYNDKAEETYSASSYSNVEALEVISTQSDIYIYASDDVDQIKVVNNQGLNGFVKSINASLNLEVKNENKSFEESLTEYDTLSIILSEPTGLVAKSNSYLNIYVPSSLNLSTIYIKSQTGNISYNSSTKEEGTEEISCSTLYLKTGDSGKIDINNDKPISNYYLKTDFGSVKFNNVSSLSLNTIKFETQQGTFDFTNKDNNANLSVSNTFLVKSSDSNVGPTIKVNKLNGNLKVEALNGYYAINEIGNYGDYKTIAMTLNKSTISFGTVYAFVSILSDGENVANYVNIDNLYYTAQTNIFECGDGSIKINNLDGDASFDLLNGNINLNSVSITSDVYIYTNNGNVNVNYISSTADNSDTNLTIITKTGNIDLTNLSCSFDIEILENSSDKHVNIVFTAVAFNDNIIDAKNRKVNLTLKGVSDSLQFRIVSTHDVYIYGDTVGKEIKEREDSSINNDYLLNVNPYSNYTKCYRIGYTKEGTSYTTNAFDMWGKLLIKTDDSITVVSNLA